MVQMCHVCQKIIAHRCSIGTKTGGKEGQRNWQSTPSTACTNTVQKHKGVRSRGGMTVGKLKSSSFSAVVGPISNQGLAPYMQHFIHSHWERERERREGPPVGHSSAKEKYGLVQAWPNSHPARYVSVFGLREASPLHPPLYTCSLCHIMQHNTYNHFLTNYYHNFFWGHITSCNMGTTFSISRHATQHQTGHACVQSQSRFPLPAGPVSGSLLPWMSLLSSSDVIPDSVQS